MFGKSTLKFDEVIEALQSHLKVNEKPESSQTNTRFLSVYAKGKERGRSQTHREGAISLIDQNPKELRI